MGYFHQACRLVFAIIPRMKDILVCMHSAGHSQRDFLAGVAAYARTKGDWSIRFDPNPAKFTTEALTAAIDAGIAGAILCEDEIPNLNRTIRTTTVPIVIFGATRSESITTSHPVGFAMSDDIGVGVLAAEHFLNLGAFRSFGYVPDPDGAGWSVGHLRGFHERLKRDRKPLSVFRNHGTPTDRRIRLAKWLDALPKPAAVMAACDALGAEVLNLCRSKGIDVPKVVSVIGVGNDALVDELATPALTSIAVNHEAEGRLASALLDKLLRKRSYTKTETVRCDEKHVVTRGSTQHVAPASHLVTSALDYIRANATKPIKVSDVVRHLGVSRRLVDLRFMEFQNESINNAIIRIRLEEVRRKLLISSLPISRIATVCGFQNPSYLKKLFLARYGEPMDSYRS